MTDNVQPQSKLVESPENQPIVTGVNMGLKESSWQRSHVHYKLGKYYKIFLFTKNVFLFFNVVLKLLFYSNE